MRDILDLFVHVIVTVLRLARPGGFRSVISESTLVRHQLLILNRGRKRAPNLRVSDRIIAGLCTLFMRPARVLRSAIVLRPSTLLRFHHMLIKRKYRLLFSPNERRRPSPKGPTKELIDAVVETKRRNPSWGCPRIAEQITLAFGVDIDKDVVRRILAMHFRPQSGSGPSWLAVSFSRRKISGPSVIWRVVQRRERIHGHSIKMMVAHVIGGLLDTLSPIHIRIVQKFGSSI